MTQIYGFVLTALIEIGVGFFLFLLMWWALDKLLPFSLKTALSEKKNPAVAVILFSIFLGLAIILSATRGSSQHPIGRPVPEPSPAASKGG